MNERIQELIKQAMVLDDDELFVREVFDREKFAELIVRECANYIADKATIETLLGERLMEHFGVK